MAFLQVNPRYQALLEQQGLTTAVHFLEMPSVIICGHPDRNVARVALGTGSGAIPAFLKREHRVSWKDRLLNAMTGFGFASKSRREAAVLRSLQQAGVHCPDWIAVGEDDQGRAFLLLRALSECKDLRLFLGERRQAPEGERRRFARRLGEALAGFHNAAFHHPDLYSKHAFVNAKDQTISFVDWQRSRCGRRVSWRRRCRDLAALEATVADDLATERERLICLHAYLQKSGMRGERCRTAIHSRALQIRRLAGRLLCQRRIRELRRLPAAGDTPELIWQDGEALCLTPNFRSDLAGRIPDWLVLANFPPGPRHWEARTWVDLSGGRRALLIRRRESYLLNGLRSWLRRRPPTSPELRRAGLLFRLERYGIHAPRLLAFGQRTVDHGGVQSFLLVEPPPGAVSLKEWFGRHSTGQDQRRRLIRQAADVLRRVHSIYCYFGGQCCLAVVQQGRRKAANIVLTNVDGLQNWRGPNHKEAMKDLAALHGELSSAGCGRTVVLRFILRYLGRRAQGGATKRLARALLSYRDAPLPACAVENSAPSDILRLRTAKQGALP